MARTQALTRAQSERWLKLGKPKTFKWRGKVIEGPTLDMFQNVEQMWRGGVIYAHEIEKAEKHIEVLQEKLDATQEKLKELQAKAVALWKKDETSAHELGGLLWEIKALMKHGDFHKWWTRAGLSQARVSYCMRVAAPEGDKVKAAKEKVRQTPRAKAFSLVNDKLSKLWELASENNTQKANELFQEIIAEIKERFIANLKTKTMAANA